jgi:hypothetical protein
VQNNMPLLYERVGGIKINHQKQNKKQKIIIP